MALVYVASATFTVSPTAVRQRPSLPIWRLPDTATSQIRSWRFSLGIEPSLDDLDAIEIRPIRVADRSDQECR